MFTIQLKNAWRLVFASTTKVLAICVMLSFNVLANSQPDLNYTLPLMDGGHANPAQFTNKKPVYLKFWASWCKPCMQEMPHLQHTHDTRGEEIQVIAVNVGINETQDVIRQVMKDYELTMPVAIDDKGNLAKTLNFVGTPFHVLLNKSGQIVHQGHQANDELDHRINLLAKDSLPPLENIIHEGSDSQTDLARLAQTDPLQVLYFTSTWCDWYLQDTRPEMSKACIAGQTEFNRLSTQLKSTLFKTVVSHLWTGPEEVSKYAKKYHISHPVVLDDNGDAFFAFGIRNFPTFVIVKNHEEIFRTTSFDKLNQFAKNNLL